VTVTPVGTTCSVSAATSVGTAGGVQAYIIKAVSPLCFGQCNGAIKVKAIGGTAPFTYHWSSTATNIDSLNNICAGTYNVNLNHGMPIPAPRRLLRSYHSRSRLR
jgi:hypothetical protein